MRVRQRGVDLGLVVLDGRPHLGRSEGGDVVVLVTHLDGEQVVAEGGVGGLHLTHYLVHRDLRRRVLRGILQLRRVDEGFQRHAQRDFPAGRVQQVFEAVKVRLVDGAADGLCRGGSVGGSAERGPHEVHGVAAEAQYAVRAEGLEPLGEQVFGEVAVGEVRGLDGEALHAAVELGP
ncbi:hypothetical protein [Streptomyces sp. NPDC056713]|uniref:hypothetical protein n=1 Tax=Streptomyces sp. NPDC056713 TaxID=3345921 RepID=UPI00367E66FA